MRCGVGSVEALSTTMVSCAVRVVASASALRHCTVRSALLKTGMMMETTGAAVVVARVFMMGRAGWGRSRSRSGNGQREIVGRQHPLAVPGLGFRVPPENDPVTEKALRGGV